MSNDRETLDDLRREIDEIDTDVHDLLIRRADLVERIRAVKRLESIATVRPGREAFILRRVGARHKGRFPTGAILRIWREIIAGITRMEMPDYAIAVYVSPDAQGYWDMARDQFGSFTPMRPYTSARDVLRVVDEGRASLGVLPQPENDDPDPWWTGIMVPGGLRVVYKLPFIAGTNARPSANGTPAAYAVGRILPEATDDDRTLIVVETADSLSRAALSGIFERTRLDTQFIASCEQGAWFHLIAVKDFVRDNDSRLTVLNAHDDISRTIIIGSYAEPLSAGTDGAVS